MKKVFRIFLAVLLASVVTYSGLGVNVYFFCCDDCSSEGISAIIDHKCCEVHHDLNSLATHDQEHACRQLSDDMHDACGVERFPILWESLSKVNSQILPITIFLNTIFFQAKRERLVQPESSFFCERLNTQKPPNLTKNDYFSLLTTLII